MDTSNQTEPIAPLNVPIETPATGTGIMPVPTPAGPRIKPEIITALVVVLLGVGALLGIKMISSGRNKPMPVVEQTVPTPTPTPTHLPSALATQSAFLKLQANVASLSGAIKNYVVDDPSLSPPVLELPLGFQ